MVTHNFSLVDDTRKWGVMRHFFSLAVLWEVMGRHCPCFTCAGALQERPPLSLPLSRETRSPQDLSSKRRTGEGWLRSAVPQLSCSLMKHSALRVRSRAGGWTSLLLLHQHSFPPKAGGSKFVLLLVHQQSPWKWMILPSFQVLKWDRGTPDLDISKGFMGIQPLEDHLVPLVRVALVSLHRQDPTSLWHRTPSSACIYSVFQRRVVQQLNCCRPLQAGQRLPTDACAAPSGSCDLPWSYLR